MFLLVVSYLLYINWKPVYALILLGVTGITYLSALQIEYNRKRKRLDFPVLKFVKESQDWARAHGSTNETEINKYLADYAVGYANSIKDLVVEDKEYLETSKLFTALIFCT